MRKASIRSRPGPKRRLTKGLAIGLTGGIACGKTEVARILERLGAQVADADIYAREAIHPGKAAYRRVVRLLGPEIVRPDGTIDRRRVAQTVVENERLRSELEHIIHPIVIRRLKAWVREVTGQGRVAVAVVPLLHEVGMTDLWDAVICVTAPKPLVLRRLANRGMSRNEARAWIRAQWPVREKAKRSHFVICNDGSLKKLEQRVTQVWEMIVKRGVHES